MKSQTEYLTFNIPSTMIFVNITPQVEEVVRKSAVAEGFVHCNSMHITTSVFVHDDEAGLHHDFGVWLEQLAPYPDPAHYHHNRTGEDNADAHFKRQIMGQGGCGRHREAETRLRSVGADFLRRVRRPPPEGRWSRPSVSKE